MWCCSAVGWKFFNLLCVAAGTWQVKCCGLIIHSLNSNIDWDVWIHSMRSSKKPWLCGPLELLRVWLLHHCAKQTNQIKIWRRHVTNLEMWKKFSVMWISTTMSLQNCDSFVIKCCGALVDCYWDGILMQRRACSSMAMVCHAHGAWRRSTPGR